MMTHIPMTPDQMEDAYDLIRDYITSTPEIAAVCMGQLRTRRYAVVNEFVIIALSLDGEPSLQAREEG